VATCEAYDALLDSGERTGLHAMEPAALDLSLQHRRGGACNKSARAGAGTGTAAEAVHDEVRTRPPGQYHVVDPENRLVAVELERRGSRRCAGTVTLQEQYDRFPRERPVS